MTAYYNEIDKKAAAWLRELIKQGHIAPGDVDERSIEDVHPDDIRGYIQCHFFAGIGIWSAALRGAGWPDDRPVWTGSCPCQPFSAAGKREGVTDERHLWPAWYHLKRILRPRVVLGEQVAGKNGLAWLDIVQADLEAVGYASGAVPMAAAGFGAPHIRERTYWVAHDPKQRWKPWGWSSEESDGSRQARIESGRLCSAGGMGDSESVGWLGRENDRDGGRREYPSGQAGEDGGVGDDHYNGRSRLSQQDSEAQRSEQQASRWDDFDGPSEHLRPGPTNGFWRDVDWLGCRDNKFRPVEPGTFPLVNGASARVGRLRGYGNGIVKPQAEEFIKVVMEYLDQ